MGPTENSQVVRGEGLALFEISSPELPEERRGAKAVAFPKLIRTVPFLTRYSERVLSTHRGSRREAWMNRGGNTGMFSSSGGLPGAFLFFGKPLW